MSEQTVVGFTPGPWEVVTDDFNDAPREGMCASICDRLEGVFLAEVWCDFEAHDEADERAGLEPRGTGIANAHLIAAAPDLYAACRAAEYAFRVPPSERIPEQLAALEKMRAALQKAEGR